MILLANLLCLSDIASLDNYILSDISSLDNYFNVLIFVFTGPAVGKFEILHIAIGASISSFFCIILVICGLYHRRKFRPDRKPPANDHVEVRYVAAASSCNTTDRLLSMDQNDGRTTIVTSPHQTPIHTPNQVHVSKSSNPGTPVQGGTPNQTPNFSNANRTSNNRAPRIQKVSIV